MQGKIQRSLSPGQLNPGQKQQPRLETSSTDAPPLDFSFQNIVNLIDLKFEDPRKGQRQPKEVIETKIEQEQKPDQQQEQQAVEQQNQQGDQQGEEGQRIEGEEVEVQEKKEKKDLKKKEQQKAPEIIRAVPTTAAQNIMTNNHISLSTGNNKQTMGGKTFQENKGVNILQKKVKVNLICSSLILSYNKIRSIQDFYPVLDSIMFDCINLQWIDLSHNHLETIDYDFTQFPNLKSLYLHCNYIRDLKELEVLQKIPSLRTLTIHGNPLEVIPGFRIFVISIVENLKRLDSVLISKKERDNANVFTKTIKFKLPPPVQSQRPPQTQINPDNKDQL